MADSQVGDTVSGADSRTRGYEAAISPPDPRVARLPIHFFVLAIVSFAVGLAMAPWVVPKAIVFFYQPGVLALVHTFTLGWITAVMMGVMYRYVPALTRRAIPFPRLGMPQLVLYAIGASGIVTHFALGSWDGVWSAAIVAILSMVLFAVNMFACLGPRLGRGVAETGMFVGIGFLIAAAVIGFLLALDKTVGFLGGELIGNLAAHAHLAAVGWVALTICAVSYRMLPAFLLPKTAIPRIAVLQLYGLAVGAAGLSVGLIAGTRGSAFWGAAVAVALVSYVVTVGRIVRDRRMPIDWAAGHAIAGITWMLAACGLGPGLAWLGASSEGGARIASAYGLIGLMGFFSNFIIGMSYHLFPGFVSRARTAIRWRAMTVAELGFKGPRSIVFVAFNGGIAILAAGFIAANVILAEAGTVSMAAGGLVYAAGMLRTLSYAYRRAQA